MCRGVNPRMLLKRARFSACINQEIDRAFATLQIPDENLSHAVPPTPAFPQSTRPTNGRGTSGVATRQSRKPLPGGSRLHAIEVDGWTGWRCGCHQPSQISLVVVDSPEKWGGVGLVPKTAHAPRVPSGDA